MKYRIKIKVKINNNKKKMKLKQIDFLIKMSISQLLGIHL